MQTNKTNRQVFRQIVNRKQVENNQRVRYLRRQKDRQTFKKGRQTDRQIRKGDRQTDRQTDRRLVYIYLKSACHESIMNSSLGENGQVDVEHSHVDDCGHDGDGDRLYNEFGKKCQTFNRSVTQTLPQVSQE